MPTQGTLRVRVTPVRPGDDPGLDKGGFVLFYRRLEEGRLKLPHMTPRRRR